MIVYSLTCARGHDFEGWFASIAAFDEQAAKGKLLCPVCNSTKVIKAPMAPALAGSVGERGGPIVPAAPAPTPSAPAVPVSATVQHIPDELRKMRQLMSGLRRYIEQNAEYVGPKFPDEARKIHYGETEDRHIYGEASMKDVADLVDEGIDIAPLPPDINEAN
jgi:hypothetical protein